ncbi:hypothetical protein [Zobellia uliginosa]|uniref:hypothetical protein n=1 Tax=Zobellia uliginosa TaxID=143224 RepID=UPI001C06C59A|nr:hypothetical protein [Zobellia uliginosa]MBU2945867.1 hypothetical protein [Zobellia uliginosa]
MTIKLLRINQLFLLLSGVLIFAISCTSDKKTNESVESDNPKITKPKLQSGFNAEHLYSPGDNEMGLWVAMTFDNKERLITSDQYGALYRMEVAPIDSDNLVPEMDKPKIQSGKQIADSVIEMG